MTIRVTRSRAKALVPSEQNDVSKLGFHITKNLIIPITPESQEAIKEAVPNTVDEPAASMLITPVTLATVTREKGEVMDELPDNLGPLPSPSTSASVEAQPAATGQKRKVLDELPHNLGPLPSPSTSASPTVQPAKIRVRKGKKTATTEPSVNSNISTVKVDVVAKPLSEPKKRPRRDRATATENATKPSKNDASTLKDEEIDEASKKKSARSNNRRVVKANSGDTSEEHAEKASIEPTELIEAAPVKKRTRRSKASDADTVINGIKDVEDDVKAEDDSADEYVEAPKKKRVRKSKKSASAQIEDALPETTADLAAKVEAEQDEASKVKKVKKVNYGLTPGETPFPEWPAPSHEQCYEVARLLSDVHGEVVPPKVIPAPSTTVSGCGEVPSVLDALIRTRLSAATTGTNSSRAFQGLVTTFGILDEGIGKGSVDWDNVRRSDVKEIEQAIKSGGLAETKSKDIKAILEMVYDEGQARRDALVVAQQTGDSDQGPAGAEYLNNGQKQRDIDRANSNVLSLDHLHSLPSEEAFTEMVKYPGIGPKTASCVLLFCLQRPSFAVDTHVFRLCKWLGWVPPGKANRNNTFSHCEVKIPDELKYPLHQLFIKHGKTCPRCRAATSEGAKGWEEGCAIDHLLTRTGVRKGPKPPKQKKPKKEEDDGSESELSDVPEGMSDTEEPAEEPAESDE